MSLVKVNVTKRQYDTGKIVARPEPTGKMVPCTGEAHSNAFIDHCMMCLGHKYGQVPEVAPVDVDAALNAGLVVEWIDAAPLDDDDQGATKGRAIFARIASGELEEVQIVVLYGGGSRGITNGVRKAVSS